ncbi:hypothetical protein EDB85DRAFT_2275550 [Lactarius pseudohatsudake]|nr:hypothetical protein EDB85DRAFT_2275550 [Lactarius pseudohatsudake]
MSARRFPSFLRIQLVCAKSPLVFGLRGCGEERSHRRSNLIVELHIFGPAFRTPVGLVDGFVETPHKADEVNPVGMTCSLTVISEGRYGTKKIEEDISLARPPTSRPPFYRPRLNAVHNRRAQHGGRRGVCTGAAAARHCTAGGAGGQLRRQLRRNAEHFSSALGADEGVLRAAEERMVANLDVVKRERERLRDHRGKALGTTCLAISSVVVVAIAL